MQINRKYILSAACLVALSMTVAAFTPANALFGKKAEAPTVSAFAKTEAIGGTLGFTRSDFEESATETLSGIIVTTLPEAEHGRLVHAGSDLAEGNVIAAESLDSLSFIPTNEDEAVHTSFRFIPVFSKTGAATESTTVSINMTNETNTAPIAHNASYETYNDLKLNGNLTSIDFESDPCSYSVVDAPKYGSLTIEGASFIYTPTSTKSKTDSFTFVSQDQYGAASKSATVSITLVKRDGKETLRYTDMSDNPAHYAALKLSEAGILRGESIGASSFLYPTREVTRAQFISMVSSMYSLPLPTAAVSTGMGDNEDIPTWAKPCIAAALSSEIVTGEMQASGNRVIRASDAITKAEAAVIVNRILNLAPDGREVSYTDMAEIPDWASQAVINTVSAGYLPLEEDGSFSPNTPMTRADVASTLYRVTQAVEDGEKSFFDIFK